MVQEYRNIIGNWIILVILKKDTTKWGLWWFENTEILFVSKLSWLFQRKQQQSEVDDDSRIEKCYW